MADDFCKFFDAMVAKYTLKPTGKRKYHRDSTMSKAERRVNQQVQNYKTCLKNSRFGVEKFNFSLGLSFNFFCIEIILLSV